MKLIIKGYDIMCMFAYSIIANISFANTTYHYQWKTLLATTWSLLIHCPIAKLVVKDSIIFICENIVLQQTFWTSDHLQKLN